MELDVTSPTGILYEGVSDDGSADFAISEQGNEFVADIFDSRIKDAENAYIATECYDSLKDAIIDLKSYALL